MVRRWASREEEEEEAGREEGAACCGGGARWDAHLAWIKAILACRSSADSKGGGGGEEAEEGGRGGAMVCLGIGSRKEKGRGGYELKRHYVHKSTLARCPMYTGRQG